MPFRVECPTCRAAFRVGEGQAGKRGKCPRCKTAIEVPAPDESGDLVPVEPPPTPTPMASSRIDDGSDGTYSLKGGGGKVRVVPARAAGLAVEGVVRAAEPTRPTQTPAQILAAFRGEIEPVRPTPLYRLWVVIVAGVMILLPLVYIAIIGLLVLGLGLHAVNDVTLFQTVGNGKAAFLAYFGPLAAGGVVLAFMFKPLFARPAKGAKTRALDPEVEPLLFAFVDGVCSTVGAPRPARIEVNCAVNASAHLDGGRLAILGNELVLTIGLPLAAGMTVRQFAGVLAHEFGHFSQSAGMRLSLLVWSVNVWFARVVYERDEWDEALANWSTGGNGSAMLFALTARLAVWLTRRVLWVLMNFGRLVSGFLSRQMEYDADRYMARMVGGPVFARVLWRLHELSTAESGAYIDLGTSWQERRLPDNLPKLILANVPQISREFLATLRKEMGQRDTGLFDTHPSDKDRIARARVEADEGVFHLEGPATDLFRNFDSLARAATFDRYRALLGPEVSREQLFTVAELVQSQAVTQEGHVALDRYFLDAYNLMQKLPLPWNYPVKPADPRAALQTLARSRAELEATRGSNLAAVKRWEALQDQAVTADTALTLLKAGNTIKASDFGLKKGTTQAAESVRGDVEAASRLLAEQFEPFETIAARRLTTALGILEADAVAARFPDGHARRDEARALYPCAAHLGGRVVPEIPPLARDRQTLGRLLGMFQDGKNSRNQPLINACLRAAKQLHDRLEEFRWKVGDTLNYPFEHAHEDVTLARFALPVVPETENVGDLLQASEAAIERLMTLYRRALGRLALTAEEVERALGLPPIETAKPEETHVDGD